VRQARNLLDFLAKSVGKENTPYSLLLQGELESVRRSSDSYLYHEHLEDVNEPVYFYQFAERAAAHGLKYLGEVDLRVMVPGNYPPEVENVLQMLAQDHIHMEQYMDFLRNRMFRQTLLCHKNLNPNYALRGEQLTAFHIASPARAVADKPDICSTEAEKFETPDGITLNSREPLVKAAMMELAEVWPHALAFKTLLAKARERLQAAGQKEPAELNEDTRSLGQALLTFYATASTSLVELSLNPPKFTTRISERPIASPLARLQAQKGGKVTNYRHESVFLGEFERHLLRLLDGKHSRGELLEALAELVAKGELTVEKDGESVTAGEGLRNLLAQGVKQQLPRFARSALLIE
jgi:methyltransferase-like protein